MRAEPTAPTGTAPLDPAQALSAVGDAADRAQLFAVMLRAARSRTRYAALLSIHADAIKGRKAFADDDYDCNAVKDVVLPRNVVPSLEQAVLTGSPYIGPLGTGEPYIDGLLDLLGGAVPSALVLPLTVDGRSVALVVCHNGAESLAPEVVAELYPLATALDPALAKLADKRADAAAERPVTRASTAPITAAPDDVEGHRKIVAWLRQHEAWEELADAIRTLIRLGMQHGEPDEDEQLELLIELGTVEAERLDRSDLAIEAWRSALTIDAGERRVLDSLEQLLVRLERWDECIDLMEKRAALTDDMQERIGLLLNIAVVADEHTGDQVRAIEAFERVLAWDPAHERAARSLVQLYWKRQQWQPLAALLLDRASKHPEERERVAALEVVAKVYEEGVGDARAAFLVWLAVLRRHPNRPNLLDHMGRLAPAANAWDEILAETAALASELEAEHAGIAARLWRQVGQWRREHRGNHGESARALDRAQQLGDPEALGDLIELLRIEGPWNDLASALVHAVDIEPDPSVRGALNVELGEVYEQRLGQPTAAMGAYQRVLPDEPENPTALAALRRLYRDHQAWEGLATVLNELATTLGGDREPAEVVDLYMELGSILSEQLKRPDDAARAFQDALAIDPEFQPAFRGLAQVYESLGQTEALLDTTEAEVDAAPDQANRYADIANAWQDMFGRLDRAATSWQKLLARDPGNLAAHEALARTLRKAERWEDLIPAHRAHLEVIAAVPERTAILLSLAELLELRANDVDGAIAAAEEVRTLDAENVRALDSLGRLYERAGRLVPAVDALESWLAIETDPHERADLHARIGQLHVGRKDSVKARVSLEQAVALDPMNAIAQENLARLDVEQGDLMAAGDHLVRAADLYAQKPDVIRCLNDAAWLYRDRVGDRDKARECLRRVLELSPDDLDARRALAEILQAEGEWLKLWPHLEQLVARTRADANAAPGERHDVYTRAARCATELARYPTALELFDLALEVEPANITTLLARAESLSRGKAWPRAVEAYQGVLARHGNSLEAAQRATIFRQLASANDELGQTQQALAYRQKALDVDPTDTATLRELIDRHQSQGNFDEAIAGLRALMDAVPVEEKPVVLEQIGDLYRTRLANPARAASSYLQALELEVTNRRVLQKLLDLQTETGQWKQALETIDRFVELETDPARRGTYLLASAEIRRTKTMDDASALDYYEKALDEFFGTEALDAPRRTRALEAFQAIDELLTEAKDWKRQEQSYRRMIKRLPKNDPVLLHLWHALGEIYRTRLKHYESAIEAFEVAHALDPDKSGERGRILAELYAIQGGKQPDAVSDRAAKLVEVDPTNPDAYRALGLAALEAGNEDEAWCVSRALVFLEQANEDEDALYRRYQGQEARKATGILDDDNWELVRSPDEDRVISSIFALVWEGPVSLRAGPPKSFHLKEKERLHVETDDRVMAKIFRHAARVLNAPLPEVYVQPRRNGRLLLANCVEKGRLVPAVIVGRDLMAGYRDTEIAAAAGSFLALLRPSFYLRVALPNVEELEAALAAAARLVGKGIGRPELAPLISAFGAAMEKRIATPALEMVAGLIGKLPPQIDLGKWRNAVDVAARRAGLLVAGELAAASRMVSSEAAPPGGPRPIEKVQDLVAYSVSPGYFTVRRHLGVSVR